MGQTRRDDALGRASRVYRWMVRLYPASYRRLFGEQMLQTFQDHYRDAVTSGEESASRFWLGVTADEAKALPRARLASLQGTLHAISLAPLLPVVCWTALAAVATCVSFVFAQIQFLPVLGPRTFVRDLAHGAIISLIVSLILVAIPFALVVVTTTFFPYLYGRAPRRETLRSRGWLRSALLLGVLVGVYGVILNLVATLTASYVYQRPFSVVTTFIAPVVFSFAFGVVGALLGYARGTARSSAAAGFAAGFLGGLISVASLVLVIALAWEGVRTNAFFSIINYDYLHVAYQSSPPHGLWQFIVEDELGGAVMNAGKIALLGGSFAALGGALGALASGRSQAQSPLATGATARRTPERAFILIMGVLGLVVWLVSALFLARDAAAGALISPPDRLLQSQRFSLLAMSLSSLTAPAFFLWAGVFAIPICAVIVTARRARALSAIPDSPWWFARTAPSQTREETITMNVARPRLRNSWRVYLFVLLLIPAMAAVYGIRSETAYESTVSLIAQSRPNPIMQAAMSPDHLVPSAQTLAQFLESDLRSPAFLLNVARDTSLSTAYDLSSPAGQNAAVARISDAITVSADTSRNIVIVTAADWVSPHVAQELATAVLKEFIAFNTTLTQNTTGGPTYELKQVDPPTLPTAQTVEITRALVYPIAALVGIVVLFILTGISYQSRVAPELYSRGR